MCLPDIQRLLIDPALTCYKGVMVTLVIVASVFLSVINSVCRATWQNGPFQIAANASECGGDNLKHGLCAAHPKLSPTCRAAPTALPGSPAVAALPPADISECQSAAFSSRAVGASLEIGKK
jgi:hypothetical protein